MSKDGFLMMNYNPSGTILSQKEALTATWMQPHNSSQKVVTNQEEHVYRTQMPELQGSCPLLWGLKMFHYIQAKTHPSQKTLPR